VKLLIISHTPHYCDNQQVKGWGATLREVDHLATLFDHVAHIAPLHPETAPESALPYTSDHVTFEPVPVAGGPMLWDKLAILWHMAAYVRVISQQLINSDVVHIRAPANIALIAMVLLAFRRGPEKRWIKYAGNWKPQGKEALSYTFQRWWLRRNFAHAEVTVNGEWDDSPQHVHAFLNPCLTDEELLDGQQAAAGKQLTVPVCFVFVGRAERVKGLGHAIELICSLSREGLAVSLDIIGDGPERVELEYLAQDLHVGQHVRFHGWKPRTELSPYYRRAHFVLLPSNSSEGWPKVLSEAMAYGVVPLASDVSSIPQILQRFGTGKALPVTDTAALHDAVLDYLNEPDVWKAESANAVDAASHFSYAAYLAAVRQLLEFA
jgi:glycosyltransferase involved in cell wall biosynthesis